MNAAPVRQSAQIPVQASRTRTTWRQGIIRQPRQQKTGIPRTPHNTRAPTMARRTEIRVTQAKENGSHTRATRHRLRSSTPTIRGNTVLHGISCKVFNLPIIAIIRIFSRKDTLREPYTGLWSHSPTPGLRRRLRRLPAERYTPPHFSS